MPTPEGTASGGSGFTSAPSCSLGCGTNSNRGVLAFVFTDRGSATTIDSCTCNGNAMTAHTAFTHGSGYDGRLFSIAGDSNIATGSNTVTATLSDANTKPGIVAIAYSGVDSTSPFSGATNVQSFSSAPSWTISSASGDTVAALFAIAAVTTSVTPNGGAAVRFGPTLANIQYGVIMDEAGASSVTIDATLGANREWWGTAISIKAASAAGLVVNPLTGIGGSAARPLAG